MKRPTSQLIFFVAVFVLLFWGGWRLPWAVAAQVSDMDAGTLSDDFADGAGLSAHTNANVDVADGKLKLTNGSSGFTAPFNTSGSAITNSVAPLLMAKWGTLTMTKTTPANTSVTVQVLDELNRVYSETLLPGNTAGFSTTTVDVSPIPLEKTAGQDDAKFGRIRFKFILATTDTSVTPSIDSYSFNWTVKQGNLSASPLASTNWALSEVNKNATRHTSVVPTSPYLAFRWVKNQGLDLGGGLVRGSGNVIYNKTQGGFDGSSVPQDGYLRAINRETSATIWQRPWSGDSFSNANLTLSQNGTIYISDLFNDVLIAYDGSTGTIKWSYAFGGGHGNANVTIGDDGTIYTVRDNNCGCDDAILIYAFNPDGTVKWTKLIDPPDKVGQGQILFGIDGKILVPTTHYDASFVPQGDGTLYALNPSDGSIAWQFTGVDSHLITPVVNSDGTIYLADSVSGATFSKKMLALNSDGSVKWTRSIGSSADTWKAFSLRFDGLLLAFRSTTTFPAVGASIEAVNTTDGSLAWTMPVNAQFLAIQSFFSDASNGFYASQWTYQNNTSMDYYDANRVKKWSFNITNPPADYRLQYFAQDESGRIYGNLLTGPIVGATTKLFALYPWSITPALSSNSVLPGDTVSFTATTTMQQTNPLTVSANKMQVLIDGAVATSMSYASTDSNGDTVWNGSYQIPSSLDPGSHSVTFEASAAKIQTDIPVHFTSPANNSGNTGYTAQTTLSVESARIGGGRVGLPTVPNNGELVYKPELPVVKLLSQPSPLILPVLVENLTRGPAIKSLQVFLNKNSFVLAKRGLGSSGHETMTLGYLTSRALKNFQKSHHLKMSGRLDAKTIQTLKTLGL